MKFITRIILQVGIILGFIGTIVVNTLSSLGMINGFTPEVLSDAIPNLFVPAGLTFAVWGVIYIGLLALTIYSTIALFKKREEESYFLDKMGIEFIIASLANIAWIFLWHYQFVALSLIAMVVLLLALIVMYLRLKIGKSDADNKEKWFVHIPISLYLGWITIATVANATALLVEVGWTRFGLTEVYWTNFMLIVAAVITLLMLLLRKDIAYSLVVIWAFVGIILKRFESFIFQTEIVATSAILIGLITIMIGYTTFRFLRSKS
jgi:hypothetical protein